MKIFKNVLLILLIISLSINILFFVFTNRKEKNNWRTVVQLYSDDNNYGIIVYSEDNMHFSLFTRKKYYDYTQIAHFEILYNNKVINSFSKSLSNNAEPLNQNNFDISFETSCINIKIKSIGLNAKEYYNCLKIPINANSELIKFNEYLNSIENNSFISHTYSNINEIDISEILYANTYLGQILQHNSNQYLYIQNSYLSKNKNVGDIFVFNKLDIEKYYYNKTGELLDTNRISLNYCEKYDCYLGIYSDTHNTIVNCIDVNVIDDIYNITYVKDSNPNIKYLVQLRKGLNNNYLFVSNKMVGHK